MADVKKGDKFVFKGITNENKDKYHTEEFPEDLGVGVVVREGTPATGIGRLKKGTEVTVREVVPAGEPGAHDDSANAVIVEWLNDEGTNQAWSCDVDDFKYLFKEVK